MFVLVAATAPLIASASIAPTAGLAPVAASAHGQSAMSVTASAPAQDSATSPRDTATFRLRARVPMTCVARFQGGSLIPSSDDTIQLGQFREFCNSPRGYALVVSYTPGTLRGAELTAGEDSVVLDGSGRAILSQVAGPKVRERELAIAPGETGFDASSLSVNMVTL